MSFANNTISAGERASSVGTVVLIHAGIGMLLVVGLQATGVIGPEAPPIKTTFTPKPIETPPPPDKPDDPQPDRKETESVITVPPIPTPIPRPDPIPRPQTDENANEGVTFDPNANDDAPRAGASPSPSPSPAPSPAPLFEPVPPRPSNDRSAWVTTRDYPASELRRRNEGVVGYRLTVSSSGRVSACEVTSSSGHARLDREACRAITDRARFTPARDANGVDVVGTFRGRVRWQIPE